MREFGPIQSQAPGFLSMLALKNHGGLPDSLMSSVQPTLDMFPFYAQYGSETIQQLIAIAANNAPQTFIDVDMEVPNGEAWYCHSVTVASTLAAAESIQLQAAVINNNVGTFPYFVGPTAVGVGTGFVNGLFVRSESFGGFWMLPKYILAVSLMGYIGGARNIILESHVTKFKA
jgi:hypothetical protein